MREFLPRLIGVDLARALLAGDRRFYRPSGDAYIPLEFADAAYRYGHAQIRHRYRVNGDSEPMPLFPDLIGFRPVSPTHRVEWPRLFDTHGQPPADRAKKIDGKIVGALIALPVTLTGECEVDEFHSLAVRDLERGQNVGLPSGELVARHIGVPPLTPDQVGTQATGWRGETPLWYYILREAAWRRQPPRPGRRADRRRGAGRLTRTRSSVGGPPARRLDTERIAHRSPDGCGRRAA